MHSGRVSTVTVSAHWQRRVGVEELSGAVVQAVRDASIRRLNAWGATFGEAPEDRSASTVGGAPGPVALDRDDFQRQLHAAATGSMSAEDRRAALSELLELAEAIERGIDEVSDKLQATLDAAYVGQSADRHVTVSMTGGGEPTAVRFDRGWLREAHEINIGRQLTAAFTAAYEKVAAQGVQRLIADSSLGEVQRRTQDPFGLAHRLRMTD
jgi:DNA-binding protein YbaB